MTGPVRSNTSAPSLRPVVTDAPASPASAGASPSATSATGAAPASTFTPAGTTSTSRPQLSPVGTPLTGAQSLLNPGPIVRLSAVLGPSEEGPIGVPVPPGFKAVLAADITDDLLTLPGGQQPGFWWNEQTLSLSKGGGGSVELLPKAQARFDATHAAFKAKAAALAKASPDDPTAGHFIASRQVAGHGSAGALVSLTVSTSRYDGEGESKDAVELQTFDTRTGQRVQLDALLSAEQFKGVVDTIEKELPLLKVDGNPDFGSAAFVPPTRAALEGLVAQHFALVPRRGRLELDVTLTAKNLELGSARFTFQGPTDAAFLKVIGADVAPLPQAYPLPTKNTTDTLDALAKRLRDPEQLREKALEVLKSDPATTTMTMQTAELVLEALGQKQSAADVLRRVLSS